MEEPTTHKIATLWRLNGERYEKHGENLAAAKSYEKAAKALSYEGDEALGYLNQAAINYRLAGDGRFDDPYWAKAHELFVRVIADTGDPTLRARAQRDKAMLCAEEGHYRQAEKLVLASYDGWNDSGDLVERAVTYGFLGRVEYMNRRYDSARYMFYVADDELRGKHDLYELNNLLWFMKVYYWYGRWYRLPRAIWLALRTGYHRRALEALLIAISPHLYERVLRAKRG